MKKCLLVLSGALMWAGILIAQPANDKCSGAIELVYYDSEEEAVRVAGDTRNTTDAALDSIPVCSGNFYRDDVWYKFTAPADPPLTGIAVKVYFGEQTSDVDSFGIAVYRSCDKGAGNQPIVCANSPGDDQAVVCLNPNEEVYVRVWSQPGGANDWQTGWGTFEIAVFPRVLEVTENPIVLWSEDFDGGLGAFTPVGIACNGGVPGDSALWEWSNDGLPVYTFGPYGGIAPVKSQTLCNGSAIFDSGFLEFGTTGAAGSGPCPWSDHEGALESPIIDLTQFDVAGVSLLFNQSMQRFAGGEHFIDYSTDGGLNWTAIQINDEKDYLSTNPATGEGYHNEEFRVRIPGVENSDMFKFRFRFAGGAYWWVVDDVRIIETEAHNIRFDERFVSMQVPVQGVQGQGIPWSPQVDILNVGARAQTNVTMNAVVQDEQGTVLYDETMNFGTLEPDSGLVNLNSTIMEPFDIAAVGPGTYTVTYTVTQDSSDFDPSDNTIVYEAYVDENNFSTERGATRTIVGAAGNWNDGVPHSFIYGNYYHTPAGSLREFKSGTFGLANTDELQGVTIGFVLFRWNEGLGDEVCQAGERDLIAFAEYTPGPGDGGTDGDTIISLEFENLVSAGPILLEDNTSYILAVQWDSPGDDGDLVMLAGDDYNYGQSIQQLVELGTPHFAGMLAVPDDGVNDGVDINTVTYGDGLSGRSIVPVARMNTELVVAVEDPLPANNLVKLYPNPASEKITVDLELEQSFDRVELHIVTLEGKLLSKETLFNVEKEKKVLDVSMYPSGTYLAFISTEAGSRYVPFVVQR